MWHDLSELSLGLFDALWNADLEACLEQVDAGFSFVSPLTNAHGTARNQLKSYCQRARSLCRVLTYRVLEVRRVFETDDTCTILVLGNVLDPSRGASGFRCTFVWRVCPDAPRLVHMHFSLPLASPEAPADTFTPDTQPQDAPLILRDTDGLSHVVYRSDVLYLESRHQYTLVHLPQRIIRVRMALSELLQDFPEYFVRVHRSYAINVLRIDQVARKEIRLDNGSRIPVPERRSKQVREKVLDAMVRARLVPEQGSVAPPRNGNSPGLTERAEDVIVPGPPFAYLSAHDLAHARGAARCGRSSRPDRAGDPATRRWTPGLPASSSCPWRRPARSCGGSRPGEGRPAA